MANQFKGVGKKVCVAVKFDDSSRETVKFAELLARRTGADLHLVNIAENVFAGGLVSYAADGFGMIPAEVLQITQEGIREEAQKKMFEFSAHIKSPVNVTTKILDGGAKTPAELIEAEALACKASLIVVGANPGMHRFIPKGFSCALSLMSSAKLPVVVVNPNNSESIAAERVQMVIADDLRPDGKVAISGGCELAFALGKTDVFHVHINGLTKEALEGALNMAMVSAHAQGNINPDKVYASVIKELETKLETRAPKLNAELELADCRYSRALLTDSSVSECLETFVYEKKAGLAVFGRHRGWHHNPLSIGQMPFHAMLALPCPIVVFPGSSD